MDPTIWSLLHDATIANAAGEVPGTVVLEIDCDYLRERFNEAGDRFELTLKGCRSFAFRPWEGALTTSLSEIAGMGLWVLSGELKNGLCVVDCSHLSGQGGGTLEMQVESAVLALDRGRVVSLEELAAVAEAYWEEWQSRAPKPVNDMRKLKGRKTARVDRRMVALAVVLIALFLVALFLTAAAGKIAQPHWWIRG